MTGYWKHATREQRLAQIDGSIEVGWTSAQCGMNVGANAQTVASYARRYGRHFPKDGEQAIKKYAAGRSKGGKLGGVISGHISSRKFWERVGLNPADAVSARIFEDDHEAENLFDPRYEEA